MFNIYISTYESYTAHLNFSLGSQLALVVFLQITENDEQVCSLMEEIDGRRTKFPLFTPKKTRQPLLWSTCLHMIGQNEGTRASFNSRRKFKFPRVMNCPIRSVFIISTENQSELESSPGFPRALPRRQSCAKEKSSGVENVLLCCWRFSRYSAPIHWLVHGHMTSNNETVVRQMP